LTPAYQLPHPAGVKTRSVVAKHFQEPGHPVKQGTRVVPP
jgi:hypothetical protein